MYVMAKQAELDSPQRVARRLLLAEWEALESRRPPRLRALIAPRIIAAGEWLQAFGRRMAPERLPAQE